jgi:KDO2-lipid IV(A) lauroyltransferase
LPLGFSLFLGALIGELIYCFDCKHRAIAYSNIKAAFGKKFPPSKIRQLTREFYRAFGQNLIEILLLPSIDKEYTNKYITIDGIDHINEGFKKGKGIIFAVVHEGSWELSNIISANLGVPLSIFVRGQRYPRLNRLLNSYRRQKNYRVIERESQMREIIRVLNNNEALGITLDQGGKSGVLVKFFGKVASMASGAVKLALKYNSVVIPVFYTRIKGPYVKIFVESPFTFKKTGNLAKDIQENLQGLVSVFEKYILRYPQEYLWTYKIYKHAQLKNILILSDGKTGHLRQSQALAKIASRYLTDKAISTNIDHVEVKFKNNLSRKALTLSSCLSGKYQCQGCLWCLKAFLNADTYKSLISKNPDIVISCGSAIAGVNFVITRENLAKSIAIMRPSVLSMKRFDLVVMPAHDKPKRGKNIVVTEGALNLIDEEYISSQLSAISSQLKIGKELVLGLLLGGDTKNFKLSAELLRPIIAQIKLFLEIHNAEILITTSRRTNREAEHSIREEFSNYSHAKLLIIANEKNIPEAVGGILGLSKIVIISPESISMISEAASSGRYVVVFKSKIDSRHDYFLNYMAKKKYIYLCEPEGILQTLEKIYNERLRINVLKDREIVKDALKRIL